MPPSSPLRIGSLFSGIGGLEKGLEDAGLGRTVWQVEKDSAARGVLHKHWPDVPRYEDVTSFRPDPCSADLICGGFPCQNLSTASRGRKAEGLSGAKSGLWSEFRRIVRVVGPRFVVVENVYRRWKAWVPAVRKDLHELGYASVALHLPASFVGAPHRRDRIFVIATDADSHSESTLSEHVQASFVQAIAKARRDWGSPPPRALGVAHGFSSEVDSHLRMYGNAVVPAVAEVVGHILLPLTGAFHRR